MKKDQQPKRITIRTEVVRQLTPGDLATARGNGMCSTGAPSGTCPTGSNYCSGKTL